MSAPVSRRAAVVAVAAGLAACAAKPTFTGLPVVRKIALIPATEPVEFAFDNQNFPLGFVSPLAGSVLAGTNAQKRKLFNAELASPRPVLAPNLNASIAAAFRRAGYSVDVLDNLKRDSRDPDEVDYEKLDTDADAIVQLRMIEVGVFSPDASPDYLPRIKIAGKAHIRARDDNVYDQEVIYGPKARRRDRKKFDADPRFAYPSFEAVMANLSAVRESFVIALDALAPVLAKELLDALATRTTRG